MAASGPPILQLGAVELRDRLAAGALRAVELAQACLAAVEAREPSVAAWAWLDGAHALERAAALDAQRASGRAIGPLHGLPVGVEDVIDAEGMPTANGAALDAGRMPRRDAWAVGRLKQAGALILGKTATAELGYRRPPATRNPHDPAHAPGGASSGSAAAVAAGMAPLAIGAQTGGSVIRPASYCGVVGYRPSFGAVPRTGVLAQSPSLDAVGVFARSVADAALLAEPLFGYDPADPATSPAPPPRLLETALSEPPLRPSLAFVRLAAWGDAHADMRDGFAELTGELGEACEEVELPEAFAQAAAMCDLVNKAEMARSFHRYESRGRDLLGAETRAALDDGKRILARDYLAARDWPGVLNASLDAVFDRFDAILTPAAPGPAPPGPDAAASSAFNAVWTFCGLPAIALPLLQARDGLPMGAQLVGRRGEDARLLRTARWLTRRLGPPD